MIFARRKPSPCHMMNRWFMWQGCRANQFLVTCLVALTEEARRMGVHVRAVRWGGHGEQHLHVVWLTIVVIDWTGAVSGSVLVRKNFFFIQNGPYCKAFSFSPSHTLFRSGHLNQFVCMVFFGGGFSEKKVLNVNVMFYCPLHVAKADAAWCCFHCLTDKVVPLHPLSLLVWRQSLFNLKEFKLNLWGGGWEVTVSHVFSKQNLML